MSTLLFGVMWIWIVLALMMWIDSTFIYGDMPRTFKGWVWAFTVSLPLLVIFGPLFWVSLVRDYFKR